MIVSALVTTIITIIASIIGILLTHNVTLGFSFFAGTLYTIIVSSILFAVSLSVSRLFAALARKLIGEGIFRNTVLFVIIAGAYYAAVDFGVGLSYHTRHLVMIGIMDWLTGVGSIDDVLAAIEFSRHVSPHVLSVFINEFPWMPPDALVSVLGLRYLIPQEVADFWSLSRIQYYLNTDLMLLLSTGIRIMFAAGFVIVFLLQVLVRGPVLLVWERVVQDNRKVFALLFGGVATISASISAGVSASQYVIRRPEKAGDHYILVSITARIT